MDKNIKAGKRVKQIFLIACIIAAFSCCLPFTYFLVFPATDETSRKAQSLPSGIIVEYCFNYDRYPNYGKGAFLMDLRWAAPGTFAVSMRSPYFSRCGYLPWIPFIKYPEFGFFDIPGLKFKWDKFCFGNCSWDDFHIGT